MVHELVELVGGVLGGVQEAVLEVKGLGGAVGFIAEWGDGGLVEGAYAAMFYWFIQIGCIGILEWLVIYYVYFISE